MTYSVYWKDTGVFKRYADFVTGQEIFESSQEVEGDRRFDTIRFVFNDFTDIKGFDISERDLDKIAAIDMAAAISNPNIAIANVLGTQDAFSLAEIYRGKIRNSDYLCKNFMDADEAWDWVYSHSSRNHALSS